ncbi:MAG: PSP1 domain-containing protein [Flavobacteriaceae bacterium]
MSCASCSTSKDGKVRGCKNNGTCATDGCNKLTVFDWLENMSLPAGQARFDVVEVRFKNSRKQFFKNSDKLQILMGDVVATEAPSGHDVGIVTLTGELVKVQMKRKGVAVDEPTLGKIYRKASQRDIEVWHQAREREDEIQKRAREIAISLNLEMKISDVELQGDASKATFYYTAEARVDFRQLIKDMARAFGLRIEMRQIGYRQEAQRLGGIGSCGRELCCSTWLSDFRSVSTSAARYQQLALNPQKLAGQCGKLKCCLNFELDTYLDALKEFPPTDCKLQTEKGVAFCQKVDIFKGLLWFTYKNDATNWHALDKHRVNEILAINKEGKKIDSLDAYQIEIQTIDEMAADTNHSLIEDSLTRFDQPKRRKKRRNKGRKTNEVKNANGQKQAGGPNEEKTSSNKHRRNSGQNRRRNQNQNRENK